MKTRPLYLGFFLAALTPSLIYSQSQTFTNCHTPESAGNFVGPDETIVNGMVCKVVKTQEQQIAKPQPAAPASSGQSPAASGQPTEITNARVVEMSKLGLDDEIIIARIKHGTCHFQLGDTDLVDLKKAGVSAKVIAAMLDIAPLTPAAPAATGRPVDTTSAASEAAAQQYAPPPVVALPPTENANQPPAPYENEAGGFPLVLHITAVEVEQGVRGVSGGGSTDSNGNYSSSVSGGGSYTWHLFTGYIDGEKVVYQLSTAAKHYKGGKGLAVATMGWSAVATGRRNAVLHIGDYHVRWNKGRTLEVQFTDEKGKLKHQTFKIESETAMQQP